MELSYVNARRKYAFFIAYFLGKYSKFGIETLHTVETITGLLQNDKLVSNLLIMKQNLGNSKILPHKNGGLKVWSNSVGKANSAAKGEYFIQVQSAIIKKMAACRSLKHFF